MISAAAWKADARARVAAGSAYLDQRLPSWRDRIRLDTLHVAVPSRCTAVQVAGTQDRGNPYQAALDILGIDDEREQDVALGFNIDPDTESAGFEYTLLTEAWRAAVQAGTEVAA